ncbi:MAG: S8 family serine peptidase [Planctomycetota bacterium]|nr:S8 family serine peptidase [Planctomycetota bacterium]
MGQALSAFTFIVIGAAIVAVAWWYFMTLRDAIFADKRAYVLGEVEVVGNSEVAETYKKVLPRLIVAKLAKLRNETNDAVQSLKEARHRRAGKQRVRSQEFVTERDLPQPFSQPLDIDLKIADVDVGPILSFLTNRSLLKESLEVTVSLSSDGKNAAVYGHLPGSQGYSFTEATKASPDDIADAVAAAIVAEVVKREEPALAALGAEAYKTVLSVLSEYAKHLKLAPILGDAGQVELSALNGRLRDTALRFSRWRDLQWLAAEISEKAKQWEDANAYYTNLAAVTPDDHPDRRLIDEKLQYAEAELQKIIVARAEATRRGVDAKIVLDEQALSRRAAASRAVAGDVANPIRQLLGLTAALDATGQTIGIVGLPWEESLNGLDYEFLDSTPGNVGDTPLRDYATGLVQAIRLIADNARYVFVPVLGVWDQGSMAAALDRLGEIQDLNVVLFAYSLHVQSAIMDDAIRDLAEKVAVVLSAGNTPGDSIYSGVADVALVTGSVTQTGAPAPFTSKTKNMVWAPGVNVPLISPSSGAIENKSGTAYSSAFAAAAAAILTKQSPDASPPTIFSALRDTAKPAEGRNSPPIINIPAATEALAASPANPDVE